MTATKTRLVAYASGRWWWAATLDDLTVAVAAFNTKARRERFGQHDQCFVTIALGKPVLASQVWHVLSFPGVPRDTDPWSDAEKADILFKGMLTCGQWPAEMRARGAPGGLVVEIEHDPTFGPEIGDYLRLLVDSLTRDGLRVAAAMPSGVEIDKIGEEVVQALRLIGRAATITEIANQAGHDHKTVKKRLLRLQDAGRVHQQSGSSNWELARDVGPT